MLSNTWLLLVIAAAMVALHPVVSLKRFCSWALQKSPTLKAGGFEWKIL
jgi:hypothetical protein